MTCQNAFEEIHELFPNVLDTAIYKDLDSAQKEFANATKLLTARGACSDVSTNFGWNLPSDCIEVYDFKAYNSSGEPVYYILNGMLFVKPGGGTGRVIAYPTVAYTESTITGFPTEWEQAVVLYASQQYVQNKLSAVTLVYTTWATYLETNKDIELGAGELQKIGLQLEEAKTNIGIYKQLLDSLNVQLQNYLMTLGIKQ